MSAPALTVSVQGRGTVPADLLNTFVQSCNSIAELRTFIGTVGMQVYMRGSVTPNDGGQGNFYWNSTIINPVDDGTNTIVPTGALSGCWSRIADSVGGILAIASGGTGAGTKAGAQATLDILPTTGGTMTGALNLNTVLNESQSADVTSAATIDLDAMTGDTGDLTGNATITAVTLSAGRRRVLRLQSTPTFTNGASLICITGADITGNIGDFVEFTGYASGVVRMSAYTTASGAALASSPASSSQLQKQVFTGTGTFTTPANSSTSTVFKATVIGAGGGGGGASGVGAAGGGGGGGGVAIKWINGKAPNTAITITVGAGGTAGANTGGNGGTGGTSSFGSDASATGGAGGTGSTSSAVAPGGVGGAGSSGDVNLTGQSGMAGNRSATWAGDGGSAPGEFGGSSRRGDISGAGGTGLVYGGGGAGAGAGGNAGGVGSAGLVVVEWLG